MIHSPRPRLHGPRSWEAMRAWLDERQELSASVGTAQTSPGYGLHHLASYPVKGKRAVPKTPEGKTNVERARRLLQRSLAALEPEAWFLEKRN